MFAKTNPSRLLLKILLPVAWWVVAATLGRCLDPYNSTLEFAILNGLASFLALYLGLGRSALTMRIMIFSAALSAAIAWEATFGEWPDYYPPLFAAASNAATILAACVVARAVAGHLGPVRWSVRDLLAMIAATGILLSSLGWLKVAGVLGRADLLAVWCIQGVGLGLIAIAAVWPIRARRPSLILLTVPFAIAMAVALNRAGDYWALGSWKYVAGSPRWQATRAVVHAVAIGGPAWSFEAIWPSPAPSDLRAPR